jgi:hypothetical protein
MSTIRPEPSGFIELTLSRRRRGRPTRRRSVLLELPGGIRARVGDQVPKALVTAILRAVVDSGARRC